MNREELLQVLQKQVTVDELVALARALIAIPSHYDHPDQEVKIVAYLEQYFKKQGLPYELQPVDQRRSNIIARLPGSGGGRSLTLNGHLDTVPPYNMQVDPFAAHEGEDLRPGCRGHERPYRRHDRGHARL